MHIFITGGTRGIGHGLVKEFLKKGHRVSFTGTSEKSLNLHKGELEGDFLGLICDIRNKKQIEDVLKVSKEHFGNIDIWINNAGVDQDRLDVSDLSEEEIRRVVDINITGMMLGTSVALKEMKEQGYGIVYNMEGLGSNNITIAQTLIYGSSKHALTYFSKGCNKELKEYPSVYVGRMQPGMVFTDLLMKNLGDDGMKVARILGNKVEDVATYLVEGAEKKKKHIVFPSYRKAVPRLVSMPFKKRDI